MRTIEFWYEFGSNYSYLSVMRIEGLAAKHGVDVSWKPFLLGPIFRQFGWSTSPFVLQEAKGRYVWREIERLCSKYELPWKKPSQFPRNSLLAARVALAGGEASWVPEFSRKVMMLNFAEDLDIASEEVIRQALINLGVDGEEILTAAGSDANRAALRGRTEEAAARGVFGAPTFFVGQEMFWGNDRLEDAIAYSTD